MTCHHRDVIQPVTIGLSGACGTGKSTIANIFRSVAGALVLDEPIPQLAVEAVTPGAPNSAVLLQKERIRIRLAQAQASPSFALRVLDRTFDEDAEIFLRCHLAIGTLSHQEVAEIRELIGSASEALGSLHAIVYCTAPPTTLAQRISTDEHHRRPSWILSSLDLQLDLYAAWRAGLNLPVVDLDTEVLSQSVLEEAVLWITKTMCCVTSGTTPRNDRLGIEWWTPQSSHS